MRFILPIIGLVCLSPLVAAPVPKERLSEDTVVMETSHGTIVIQLFPEKSPKSVANFLKYVDEQLYDGLTFHRVIKDFMIQGGGFDKDLKAPKGLHGGIACESDNGLSNTRGTIAVARAAAADSGTSQFFINTKDNTQLDKERSFDKVGYCVFGKVTKGMDIVDKIGAVETQNANNGFQNVPTKPVVIKTIRRAK